MSQTAATPRATRRTIGPTAAGLVVTAAIIGVLGMPSALSSAPSFSDVGRGERGAATSEDGVVTADDGALPEWVTVFDDRYPGVANLDPDLLHALRDAAREAADDGIELDVNSGWRSPEYQDQLLREAASEYGSAAEAARWVASAETSAHVSGDAIDIGPAEAAAWLAEHGARHGLCQTYRNEPWHFELRPRSIDRGCPRMYADPAHDPRMRR